MQHTPVRTKFLPMVRSRSFGSSYIDFSFENECTPSLRLLALPIQLTCSPIMQKVQHYGLATLFAYRIASSGSVSIVIDFLFTLSLTVLSTIAEYVILSLRGWYPYIRTDLLPFYFLLLPLPITQDYYLLRLYLFQSIIMRKNN